MDDLFTGLLVVNTVLLMIVIWSNAKQKKAIRRESAALKDQVRQSNDLLLTGFEEQLEKKLAQWNEALSGGLQEGLENVQTAAGQHAAEQAAQSAAELNRLSGTYQQHLEEKMSRLSTALSEQIDKKLTSTQQAVQNRLDYYFMQEDEEARQWLLYIKKEGDDQLAVQQLESALNRFPGNGLLVQEYSRRMEPFLQSADIKTQKAAIERCSKAARAYLDHCNPDEWNEAKELYNRTLELGKLHMKKQIKQFRKQAKKVIEELEGLVGQSSLNDAQMERVEELDELLPKTLLKNHKDLYERYQQVTSRLFQSLSPDGKEKEGHTYNLKAVKQIKKAHKLFKERESYFKKGIDLRQLAELLGTWDHTRLTPAAQLYFQHVYSDIFSKLDAEHKSTMTEMMLQVSAKKVPV